MSIDIVTLDALPNQRIEVGALLYLCEQLLRLYPSVLSPRLRMQSILDALWPFVEGHRVLYDDVYERFNEEVLALEDAMKITSAEVNLYITFARSFFYCLWVINAANWREGLNPSSSEEIADIRPEVLCEIVTHASRTGLATKDDIERYLNGVAAFADELRINTRRSMFARFRLAG